MSINKNYTNTVFAITFSGQTLKITFASPVSEIIYINKSLFYITECPSNPNWVDLGEFSQGITTVDYTLCTAPIAGTRDLWVAAVLALITGGGPTPVDKSQWGVRVLTENAATVFTGLSFQTVIYEIVEQDPSNQYDPMTGYIRVANAGNYTFGNSWDTLSQIAFAVLDVDDTGTGLSFQNVAISTTSYYCGNMSTGRYLPAGALVRTAIQTGINEHLVPDPGCNNFWMMPVP